MTASDIAKIVTAVASTQLITDLLSHRYIFQSEAYLRTVTTFERARSRRDKTATSLAAKQRQQQPSSSSKQPQGKQHPSSRKNATSSHHPPAKSIEKEAKKLQRENDEVSELAAEVARRHTVAGFYSSLAFFLLYRILSAEYSGKVVAVLPFVPFQLLQRLTFRGLLGGSAALGDLRSTWRTVVMGGGVAASEGSAAVADVGQACSFMFVYLLCTLSVKVMVGMAFGTKPPTGADDGVGTLMDSPKSRKMMEKFGLDPDEMKEARGIVSR